MPVRPQTACALMCLFGGSAVCCVCVCVIVFVAISVAATVLSLTMPSQAPIVIRSCHIIAHVNDADRLNQLLRSISVVSPTQTHLDQPTSAALVAYEAAAGALRCMA